MEESQAFIAQKLPLFSPSRWPDAPPPLSPQNDGGESREEEN